MGASRKIMHLDARRRLALGEFARADTYLVDLHSDGSLTLTPGEFTPIAATLPAKKAALSAARKRAPRRKVVAKEPQEQEPS